MNSRDSKYNQIVDIYPYLKNPKKYNGTRPITMRSSWETGFVIKYLDANENIIEWGSESKIVKYISPVDGKQHRYFIDFNFKAKTKSGALKEFWIEIKPYSQSIPPKEPLRKTKTYLNSVKTWLINEAKWTTTKRLVEQYKQQGNDVEFLILTEHDLKGII